MRCAALTRHCASSSIYKRQTAVSSPGIAELQLSVAVNDLKRLPVLGDNEFETFDNVLRLATSKIKCSRIVNRDR